MLVVDTNVLVDAANSDSPWHGVCLGFMKRQQQSPTAWFSTWPIAYEFLRVATHARALQNPWKASRAWEFLAASLFAAPGFSFLGQTLRHAEVATLVLAEHPELSGNIFNDAHTAILMREHGIKTIVTRDADFRRFNFLETVDPADA